MFNKLAFGLSLGLWVFGAQVPANLQRPDGKGENTNEPT